MKTILFAAAVATALATPVFADQYDLIRQGLEHCFNSHGAPSTRKSLIADGWRPNGEYQFFRLLEAPDGKSLGGVYSGQGGRGGACFFGSKDLSLKSAGDLGEAFMKKHFGQNFFVANQDVMGSRDYAKVWVANLGNKTFVLAIDKGRTLANRSYAQRRYGVALDMLLR